MVARPTLLTTPHYYYGCLGFPALKTVPYGRALGKSGLPATRRGTLRGEIQAAGKGPVSRRPASRLTEGFLAA